MDRRTVCISRTLAAGGEAIGKGVAERLGFRYVDEEVITAASEKAQVDPALIAQAEHRQSLLTRLLDALATRPLANPTPPVFAEPFGVAEYGAEGAAPPSAVREQYRALIREAVVEIGARGDVVIVAHAASQALAGTKGALRVLVTASEQTRIERLWVTGGLLNERDAAEAIKDSDRERRDYLLRFYGVREELPTHYDLVINTDVVSRAQAIGAIVALVQSDSGG